MKAAIKLIAVVTVLCLPAALYGASDPYAGKKLIEYGWDVPDTAYVRQHAAEMEKIPFDGVVISVKSKTKGDVLGWRTFENVRIEPEEYEHAIEDLKAARFTRLTDNFIQMIGGPRLDWFDPEWATILHNVRCLARVAKQGRCRGIMLDPEDYVYGQWSYSAWSAERRNGHSFEEYVAKVRERGKEFIRAVNGEYPDITILSLIGPSISYGEHEGDGLKRGGMYSLLYAFFDGMCEAATPGTIIIDGYEQSYSFRERELFQAGRKGILELVRDNISTNPEAYREHMRAGFGIWADRGSGVIGWWPDDFSKNYYTPEQLRASLAYALEASDGYVWVYSERFKWWPRLNCPDEYVEALALAKTGPGPGEKNPLKVY